MPDKLKGVCRLCLSKEGFMFPIFRNDRKSETPFRTKILSCASIEVFADDDLPSEVCHNCAHQVEKSFHFRTVCENSDAALRLQMNQSETDITLEDESNQTSVVESAELQNRWSEKIGLDPEKYEDAINLLEGKVCENMENVITVESVECVEGIECVECVECVESVECVENIDNVANAENVENVIGIYSCFACSLGFTAYDALIEHVGENHPDVKFFPCKPCKVYFLDVTEYKRHLNTRHALNCSKCDLVFKHQKNLDLHLKSHSLEIFTCQFCKKLFDKQFKLKQHELSHLENMCKFCCKILDNPNEYSEHIKTCNKSSCCKFCNQSFTFKKDLIEHVNSYHENSTIHKCKDCNKVFGKWLEFQQHTCKVVLEKTLQCKYCRIKFTEASELESHIISDHSEELLTCKFCTKSFTLKSALRRHEKSHSGLKPYQCKYCPKTFKDNSTCTVHIRTHTGEHPFQCQECHKDFKQLANLKMHTYRHHKVNTKTVEEKAEVLRGEQIYDRYTASIVDGYSSDRTKTYQHIESGISPAFTEGATILLTEHH